MRLTTELSIPIKVEILGKSVYNENIQIGKITKSYMKDKEVWVTIILDNKKIKQFSNLLKNLKGL